MAQKIIIQEAQEAEQWPKVVFAPFKVCPDGTDYSVEIHTNLMHLSKGHLQLESKPTPEPLIKNRVGHTICFRNGLEAFQWWSDPQPIAPPKPTAFGDLAVGDWFVRGGEMLVKVVPFIRKNLEYNCISASGKGYGIFQLTHVTRCSVIRE